ncbi:MAG: D-cysteine desulfhydrase [Gammaproteobacteria bacterium]|nr:D-cysteine desulfhydrase [Gammaproteobacteria bacterium]NNC97389.1 D-cysteine desulfhydrase [Gammaproteobacteria bacterium]NNM13575.1 D-cysteine desulfhydrase [Gammaproteobacteria bacterium]
MLLSRFPRFHFAHLPTPLEFLPRLSKAYGTNKLWIKRDDCTGLAGGGNKTRKLEFLLADAKQKNADTIITPGATQSNHCRQTAAIAAKMGLECHLIMEDRTGSEDEDYNYNGNILLDQLLGAKLSTVAGGTNMQTAMESLAIELKELGKNPYLIPGGGSNAIGALGYVNCALELLHQANTSGLKIDYVVHATGSAGTQAGLVTGFCGSGSRVPVLGISTKAAKQAQEEKVFALALETAALCGLPDAVKRADVIANSDYVGEGYGIPTKGTIDAMETLARTESILLDPVYTAKGMDGMLDLVRQGFFGEHKNIVFIHTGGAQGIHGYRSMFNYPDYR